MATLITDNVGLKANLGAMDANFSWNSIKSFVEDTERDIIAEAIGDEVLEWFIEHLAGLAGMQAKVLQLLQRAEAYIAVHKWTQTALYRFTDKNLYVAKSGDGVIISDKKLTDLRNYCEETGYSFLDKAIGLMESNLVDFPDFATSAVRLDLLKGFIKTAAEFNQQRSIENSRLSFLSMHAIMLDEQDEYLPRYMGQEYYDEFKGRFLVDALTEDEKKLLPMIRKALAYLTIARACRELPVKVTSKGLLINAYNNSMEFGQQNPADAARIQFLGDDSQETAERRLLVLQNYLVQNASIYTGYVSPAIDTTFLNSADDGLIIL